MILAAITIVFFVCVLCHVFYGIEKELKEYDDLSNYNIGDGFFSRLP